MFKSRLRYWYVCIHHTTVNQKNVQTGSQACWDWKGEVGSRLVTLVHTMWTVQSSNTRLLWPHTVFSELFTVGHSSYTAGPGVSAVFNVLNVLNVLNVFNVLACGPASLGSRCSMLHRQAPLLQETMKLDSVYCIQSSITYYPIHQRAWDHHPFRWFHLLAAQCYRQCKYQTLNSWFHPKRMTILCFHYMLYTSVSLKCLQYPRLSGIGAVEWLESARSEWAWHENST